MDYVQGTALVNAIRTTGGAVVRIEDIPINRLDEIAQRNSSENAPIHWTNLITLPFDKVNAFADLIRLAHEISGETVPADVESWSASKAIRCIERVPESTPTVYVDGIPKEEADPTTPLSSGVPEPSDGSLATSDDSPTET